jgi:hypothetical protein
MQKPFFQDDLHLADAIAAIVCAGIERPRSLENNTTLFIRQTYLPDSFRA